MENSTEMLIMFFIAFIVGVFITRFIFRIDTIADNIKEQASLMKIQTRLLSRIAEKGGVLLEDINEAFKSEEERRKDYLDRLKAEKKAKQ